MKIAIITHNLLPGDGQGRVNYELVRYAVSHGAEVWLFADTVAPDLLSSGVHWVPVRAPIRHPNLFKVRMARTIADQKLAKHSGQLDILHGNGYTLTSPHHVNTAHFVHGAWLNSPAHPYRTRKDAHGVYQRIYTRLNARWEREAYSASNSIVAVSSVVHSELIGTGLPHKAMAVIGNGVDTTEFRPGRQDRRVLGLPHNVPLALFAGELRTPRKNLDSVLRALQSLPGVHLAVVGATTRSRYPRLANQLGLEDRIHFLGYRTDLPDLMRSADLFVFPSLHEPFGMVILEAMASGLPVVISRCCGAADLLTPGSGVCLADPQDARALAGALAELCQDPTKRRDIGAAARAIAERNTWSDMAEKYLALYRGQMS